MKNNIAIISLLPEHAEQVAAVHIKCIDTGFISSLGIKFVTSMYEAIALSDSSFGYVAQQNNEVVGLLLSSF